MSKYKLLLKPIFFFEIIIYLIDKIFLFYVKYILGFIWKIELIIRGIIFNSFISQVIIGRPIVTKAIGSKIMFGKKCVLLSKSRYCLPTSIYSPCKFQTLYSSAIISVGNHVTFSGTSVVCRSSKISIGSRTMIGPNVTIMDSPFHPLWPVEDRNNYPGTELDLPIEIGEDVWIGSQVIILPGTKIGSGSIIGAGSIVKGIIEPNCLAVGSPALVVKYLANDKK